jgi:hypothetical protein
LIEGRDVQGEGRHADLAFEERSHRPSSPATIMATSMTTTIMARTTTQPSRTSRRRTHQRAG